MRRVFFIVWLLFWLPAFAVEGAVYEMPSCAYGIAYVYGRGALGVEGDPHVLLGEGRPAVDREHSRSSYRFESEVLRILEEPPAFREPLLLGFATRWGLAREQAVTVVDYYTSRLFYEDLQGVGTPTEMMSRLQRLARAHWLSDIERRASTPEQLNSSDRLALRYRYYLLALTHLSVPEMARQLRRTEHQVYDDLMDLELSLEQAFQATPSVLTREWIRNTSLASGIHPNAIPTGNLLAIATSLIGEHEWTIERTSEVLGVGPQALRFALHYTRESNRTVSWQRELPRGGRVVGEEVILRELHEAGRTASEIATELNQLAQVTDAQDSNFRTESSVSNKLMALHLSQTRSATASTNVQIAPHGFVKLAGRLNQGPATDFLIAHYNPLLTHPENLKQLAPQLGVTENTLSEFIERHNLVLTNAPALKKLREGQQRRRTDTQALLSKLTERQREVLERFARLDGGGIAALRARVLGAFSGKTQESLQSLALHLPQAEREAFATVISQTLSNKTAGLSALNGEKVAAIQVFNVLYDLVERHNRWVAEDVSTRRERAIQLSELETGASMQGVLYKLTGRGQFRVPEILSHFSNLEGGGLAAFRGRAVDGFAAKTSQSLQSLALHLPEEERTAFATMISQNLTNKTAGASALHGNQGAATQIFNVLYDLVKRHNRWVAEDMPARRESAIQFSELENEAGMRRVLYKLSGRGHFLVPEILSRFSNLEGGGLAVFRGGAVEGFGIKTSESLQSLAWHLPEGEKEAFARVISQTLTSKTAGNSALNGKQGGATQIFNVLYDLVERHNRWVALDTNRRERAIPLSALETESGMLGVLYKLTGRGQFRVPQILSRFSNLKEGGGLGAFRGGAVEGFAMKTSESFRSLALHLSQAEGEAFATMISQTLTNKRAGAAALSREQGAATQIFNVLYDLVERHNRWVAEDMPARKERAIQLSELESEAGMREVLRKLRGR